MGAALGACLVLIAVAWAASTGVGQLASGERTVQYAPPSYSASGTFYPDTAGPKALQQDQNLGSGPDLTWIGKIFGGIVLLTLAALLTWALYVWMAGRFESRGRWGRERVEFADFPETSRLEEELLSAREVHLTRLADGPPRNGIVRCWMAFEEAATAVDLPPRLTETPTEFLTRLLEQLQVDPRPGVRLAELYHVARFSSHPLTEADRAAARQALLEVHAQLGAGRGSDVAEAGS